MPMVAARLATEFGWEPKLHDPELAVAKGAAVFALSRMVYRMQQEAKERSADPVAAEQAAADVVGEVARQVGLSEQSLAKLVAKRTQSVLPRAFGVRLQDDAKVREYVEHLAHANDPLPTGDRKIVATTVTDNQTSVLIAVYEQAGPVLSPDLTANTPLTNGSGVISGIPPRPRGVPAIDVVMNIDEDGLLQLHATERESGNDLHIEVSIGLSAAELGDAIQAVSKIAVSS
jgi:molecular chaperone DnaK (HSP70)